MKTTKAQFEQFKKSFLYWQEKLGLQRWQAYFIHEKIGEHAFADVCVDFSGTVATVRLNTSIRTKLTLDAVLSGKHEAIELLLYSLQSMARTSWSKTEVDEKTHEIVRVLEKVL